MGFKEPKERPAWAKMRAKDLDRAMRIIDEFRKTLKQELQDKQDILVMSSGFESLDTAIALLSGTEWPPCFAPPVLEWLVVSDEGTRARIKDCYARLEAVKPNTLDGSPAQAACLQMQAALFTVLNMTYREGAAQEALASAMSAAGFGLGTAGGLLEAGAEALSDCYMNQSMPTLTDELLGSLKGLFRELCPQAPAPEGGSGTEGAS